MQATEMISDPTLPNMHETLYCMIPHFTVRILYGLIGQKWLAEEVNDAAYTELMGILYKVVFNFRQYFVSEKPVPENWLGEENGIVNLNMDEVPFEIFNLESILIGLKVCSR